MKSLFISDLHLGHPSIPPCTMVLRYKDMIFPHLPKVDVLFINGDLFDSALSLADTYTDDIIAFLLDLVDECIKHSVKIIATRGTFSHDRDQVKVFYSMTQNKKMGKDSRYYDTISLDEINDRRFLFLPDDLPYKNSDEILDVVQEMMTSRGWDYVDYALAHGYFDFMVPSGVHQPKLCFRPEQFSFVKRLINVGHVHTTKTYDNKGVPILYNGSPERLRHGEEEAKGFYIVEETDKDTLRIQFIENKDTTVFKDIRNDDLTQEDALSYWAAIFTKASKDKLAYYKFTHPEVGIRLAVEKLSKDYPQIVFTHRSPKETEKVHITGESLSISAVKTHVPTQESFAKDVLDFLQENGRGSTLTESLIETYLKEI